MRCFRSSHHRIDAPPGKPATWTAVDYRGLLNLVFSKEHFFVAPGFKLEFEHQQEEIPWEIFRGRLLELRHTRVLQKFESWNAYWIDSNGRSEEPILSLKLDLPGQQIHVARAIHSYVWEGYDASDNVIESRETKRWVRELVGTIQLEEFSTGGELLDEVNCLLFQAVVGNSRLPLTSLENPLPSFTLGQLGYFLCALSSKNPGPMNSFQDLIEKAMTKDLAGREKVKLLELILRVSAPEQLASIAELFVSHWKKIGHSAKEILALMQEIFNEVSLSPYTGFVDKVIAFVSLLERQGYWTTEDRVDFLSRLLRKIARHLTAYDLRTFHHRGANYPDVLLLDAVMHAYLQIIAAHPELFLSELGDPSPLQIQKRQRRRALRQGWLLRTWYEGLAVPEIPTSPGENRWVLPDTHPRVSDELILQPEKRTRRLFGQDRLNFSRYRHAEELLAQSIADLQHPNELEEMGLAIFLDRPLGMGKSPGEPDQTPLLSYLAYSRLTAEKRLQFLADHGLLTNDVQKSLTEMLDHLSVKGIFPLPPNQNLRPGVVSISDAARAAPDFIILRTTRKSAAEFMNHFHFDQLNPQISPKNWPSGLPLLIVQESSPDQSPGSVLSFYDGNHVKRLKFLVDAGLGYSCRAGIELPRSGLRLLQAWKADGESFPIQDIAISPV